jgi:hypothetical protein
MELTPKDLLCVVPFNNPMQWKSRLANMRRTEDGLLAAGVNLATVEVTYGDRPYQLPDREGVTRLRYATNDVLWQKENAVNVGFRALQWKYGAMIDGDILFHDMEWPLRTLHSLQLTPVTQISTDLVFLGPASQHLGTRQSYMRRYRVERTRVRSLDSVKYNIEIPITPHGDGYPGGAWGYRHEAFEALGGLLDTCIIGAGDQHMAWAMTETPDVLIENSTTPYATAVQAWRRRCSTVIKRDVGLVSGLATHLWHGKRADRKYPGRWKILLDNKFDPETDLVRDSNGLIRLAGNKPNLRDDLRSYFSMRNEDSVDLDPPAVLAPDMGRGHYDQPSPFHFLHNWWEWIEHWHW